jgi:hypothetical protein
MVSVLIRLFVGTLFLLGGLVLIVYGGFIYPAEMQKTVDQGIVDDIVVNAHDDPSYAGWAARDGLGTVLPNPTEIKYHFFHISNLDDVLWGRAGPALQEKGPYVYDIHTRKYDVQFDAASKSVSFKVYTYLEYNQAQSGNAESDLITTANIPYAQVLVNLQRQHTTPYQNLSETYIAARLANKALATYSTHMLGPFLAETKKKALGRYLTRLYRDLRYDEIPTELGTRYPQIRTNAVPSTLVRIYAKMRARSIRAVVLKAYRELSVLGIWEAIAKIYRSVRTNSVPHLLAVTHERIKFEAMPQSMTQLMARQSAAFAPPWLAIRYAQVPSLHTRLLRAHALHTHCARAAHPLLS